MDLITESQQKFYDEMETTNIKDVRANTPLGSLLISENGVSITYKDSNIENNINFTDEVLALLPKKKNFYVW